MQNQQSSNINHICSAKSLYSQSLCSAFTAVSIKHWDFRIIHKVKTKMFPIPFMTFTV